MQLLLLLVVFAEEKNYTQLDLVISPGLYQFKNNLFVKTNYFNSGRLKRDEIWINFVPAITDNQISQRNIKGKLIGYAFGLSHFFNTRKMLGAFIDIHENSVKYKQNNNVSKNDQKLLSAGIYGSFYYSKINFTWLASFTNAKSKDYEVLVTKNISVQTQAFQLDFEIDRVFKTLLCNSIFFRPYTGLDFIYTAFGNFHNLIDGSDYTRIEVPVGAELQYRVKAVDLYLKLYVREILKGRSVTASSAVGYSIPTDFKSTDLGSTYVGAGMTARLMIARRLSFEANAIVERRSRELLGQFSAGIRIPTSL